MPFTYDCVRKGKWVTIPEKICNDKEVKTLCAIPDWKGA
jgi:hypothetical protein